MGVQRHLRPLRIHQATSQLLEVGVLEREPPWYRIVSAIPPSTSLVRTPPTKFNRSQSKGSTKSKTLFQPKNITYPEDEARRRFYNDHPWELARPRIVLENDGKDYANFDWSHIEQRGKGLDGESVVQREMWLRNRAEQPMSARDAYNIARREFYQLRLRQDIERRIASEEAMSVGAYFGKSYMQIGLELEQNVIDDWKVRANADLTARKQRRAAAYNTGLEDDEEEESQPSTEVSTDQPQQEVRESTVPSSL